MKKKLIIFVLLAATLLAAAAMGYGNRARTCGALLEPAIERYLTALFGTRVHVRGLTVDPVTGDVFCERFQVMNQPIFSPQPHIDVARLETRVNVRELFNRKVLIEKIDLGQLHYLIERVRIGQDTRANCRMMVWAIKDYVHQHASPDKPDGKTPWLIQIKDIEILGGSFIYDNHISEPNARLVFRPLKGYVKHFQMPTDDKTMPQQARLEGFFGEEGKVPFEAEGPANFATNNVSFDLHGTIDEGPMKGYESYWAGLPIEVKDGRFSLKIRARYKEDYLDSYYDIAMRDLKLVPGKKVAEKFWGFPLMGVIGFLENEKLIRLTIPVNGDITDPKFELSKAFRRAFQTSLKTHTSKGLTVIRESSAKIATETQEIAAKTSETIMHGMGTMSDMVAVQTAKTSEKIIQTVGNVTELVAPKPQADDEDEDLPPAETSIHESVKN